MKIKFNKFERVAGLFVGAAMLGSLGASVGVAVKKGWFSSKVPFETVLPSGDGIHSGTVVQIAGLRAGAVTDVELISANEVLVKFEVAEKFQPQIREDSALQVLRPFIIGDKVIEINIGSDSKPIMHAGARFETKSSFDIMDVFSGKKMGPLLGTIERLSENLRILGEAFSDPERTKSLVKMFDRLAPLINNVNDMALGVSKVTDVALKQKRLDTIVGNLSALTTDLSGIVPEMRAETPELGKQLGQMVKSLNVLTREMEKLAPAITAIAPELPRTSLRAVEALDETVVLLKAIQKSFLFKGKVEEVRDEEKRSPAKSP